MSKAVKLRNSVYLSSESIIHKRGGGWHYLANILDNIYPVGSIFITMNSTNPSEYFGGKWEKISGGYLYATGSNSLGKTTYSGEGAQSTTLTVDQIPKHGHWILALNKNSNGYDYSSDMDYDSPGAKCIIDYTTTYNPDTRGWRNSVGIQMTGGNQGHTHNIATIDVWMWKRVS